IGAQQAQLSQRFTAIPEQATASQFGGGTADLSKAIQGILKQSYVIDLTANLDGREIYRNQKAIDETWGCDIGGGRFEW
ncbi:MAG: hypothetical protein RSB20_07015, partial [Clostridia bacterium]